MTATTDADPSYLLSAPASTGRKTGLLRQSGWIILGLVSLILFTLAKLPDEKIKGFVDNQIAAILAPQGITLTAAKSHLSFGLGISYVMEDVTLTPPPPQSPAKLDRI